ARESVCQNPRGRPAQSFGNGRGGADTRQKPAEAGCQREEQLGQKPRWARRAVATSQPLNNRGSPWQFRRVTNGKLERLRELIRSFGSCVVAYSGGVDSVFLAWIARDVLGDRSLAVIADSPSLPRRELNEALQIAERWRIPVRVIHTKEFSNPD